MQTRERQSAQPLAAVAAAAAAAAAAADAYFTVFKRGRVGVRN